LAYGLCHNRKGLRALFHVHKRVSHVLFVSMGGHPMVAIALVIEVHGH